MLFTVTLFLLSWLLYFEQPLCAAVAWQWPAAADASETRVFVPLRARASTLHVEGNSFRTTSYYAELALGSPAQTFKLLIDTGSSRLWVPGVECRQATCRHHRQYNQTASKTAQQVSPLVLSTTNFASGELVGFVVEELVCLEQPGPSGTAGASRGAPTLVTASSMERGIVGIETPLCVGMSISVAEGETVFPFQMLPFDGILGLKPPWPLRARQTSSRERVGPDGSRTNFGLVGVERMHFFSQQLVDQMHFSAFAVRLAPARGLPSDEIYENGFADATIDDAPAGELLLLPRSHGLGGIFARSPLRRNHSEPWWAVVVHSVDVGGVPVQLCGEYRDDDPYLADGCHAVVDTGSGYMMPPPFLFERLLAALGYGPGDDCVQMMQMPMISFKVRGLDGETFELNLSSSDYIDQFDGHCELAFTRNEISQSGDPSVWVFGQPLLRRYATIYDLENFIVGFLPGRDNAAADEDATLSPSAHSVEVPTTAAAPSAADVVVIGAVATLLEEGSFRDSPVVVKQLRGFTSEQ